MHAGLPLIITGVVLVIGGAIGGILMWVGQSQWSSRPDPMVPNIVYSVSDNPTVNDGSTATVTVQARPDFKPPYVNEITVKVANDNAYKCYMVLQFEASEGFKFLPISEDLPQNVRVGEGYEYTEQMMVYIGDFPPGFEHPIKVRVYTMDRSTYGGTESIVWKVLEQHYE